MGALPPPAAPGSASAPDEAAKVSWVEIDGLIDERRYQAALERVTGLRERAQQAGDEAEWARALVREVQLTTGLHGYETSVRHLRGTPWPAGPLYRAVLELYYAHSLVDYLNVYGWEIRQRERVETGGEAELRSWTRERIAEEIDAAYARVWAVRESWARLPWESWRSTSTPTTTRRGSAAPCGTRSATLGRLAGRQLALDRGERTASTGWIWRRC